jgi:hypothetical protein
LTSLVASKISYSQLVNREEHCTLLEDWTYVH